MRRFPGYGEYIMPAEKRPQRSFWTAAAFLRGEDLTDRIMISGVSSGCGKTTVVCAVLQALVNRGLKTGAFKCGPDYIDPMFHSRIIGAKSANLDLHFFSENTLRFLLAKNAAGCDVSVIEGAMGFYDGAGLTTWKTSAYELALVTKTPVVLVVNARGAALSVLAVIEGFLRFRPESGIRGVILNQCTAMTYASLSAAIEERFGIRCFGFLPRLDECVLESRHLGLVTAGEIRDLREKMQTLAAQAEKTLDIDALLALRARGRASGLYARRAAEEGEDPPGRCAGQRLLLLL